MSLAKLLMVLPLIGVVACGGSPDPEPTRKSTDPVIVDAPPQGNGDKCDQIPLCADTEYLQCDDNGCCKCVQQEHDQDPCPQCM